MKESRKRTNRIIIIFLATVLFLGIALAFKIVFYYNMNEIKGLPRIENEVMDIESIDLNSLTASLIMNGEWEFYYNKWIITDGYTGDSDGRIMVPGSWTGRDNNDGKLPNTGYASYKCYVKNAEIGERFTLTIGEYTNAYRIFINGVKVSESGVLSKTSSETFSRVRPQEVSFYTVENTDMLEIVVEISANNKGGLYFWPMLSTYDQYERVFVAENWYGGISPTMFFSAAIIMIFMVLVLNFIKINKKIEMPIIIYSLALMLNFIFSVEAADRLFALLSSVNYNYSHYFAYISGIILFAAFVSVLRYYKIVRLNYLADGIILGINIIAMALLYVFSGYNTRYLSLLIPAASMLYYIYYICKASAESVKFAPILLVQGIFIYMILIMQVTDNNGVFLIGGGGVYSTAFFIILILLLWMYIVQIRDTIRNSRRAEQLIQEVKEVKNKALKAQIKPHFIFNVLTSVQDLYHTDTEEADKALAKFCNHLRLNVDSEFRDMVSFADELVNIQNYFDLENIRKGGKLTLLYDIDYDDFKLPILSLQPLIENAAKYAKTEEKEDGYIQIKSYLDNENIIIEVNDNGIGFDPEKVKDTSAGLKNVTQRLKYSLNAEITINSVIGEGTTIRITIPNKKNVEKE